HGDINHTQMTNKAKKNDDRRNDDEGVANIVRLETAVEPTRVAAKAGDFYVPLDQSLANVIAAALEPETQSSYAANRVLTLPQIAADRPAYLPIYRLPAAVKLSSVVWEAD